MATAIPSVSPQESRLEAVASRIVAHAKTLSTFASPFSADDVPTASTAPELVQHARHALREAAYEIQQLVNEPSEYLEQHQIQYQQLSCLAWLVWFDIFARIPLPGQAAVPFSNIATAAQVPLARLKSVARMAMTNGLFTEPQLDHIIHTPLSAALSANSAMKDWISFMTQYSAPTAAQFAAATARWGESTKTNETAYNVAFDTDLPFFAHISQSKNGAEVFAGYMRSLNESEGTALKHVLSGFNWGGLREAHIIDIGGSTGQASILLASHYPSLTFTIQDLPETVASGPAILSSLPPAISSRITFTAHDFRLPQPQPDHKFTPTDTSSPRIFFLRKILHDWPFADAQAILNHLAFTLRPNLQDRILIMDTILPAAGSIPALAEARLRVRDLTMAQNFNSQEREMGDWEELVAGVVPSVGIQSFEIPWGSAMGILVVSLKE